MKHLVGLFGNPVEHSASPAMHKAAYQQMGCALEYFSFSIAPDQLQNAVQSVRALGMPGVNVTVPYKEAVGVYLDEISNDARIGSVNTIVNRKGRLIGHSTDGPAFFYALQEQFPQYMPFAESMIIVGSGGAARALAGVYMENNGPNMTLIDIDAAKAEKMATDLKGLFPEHHGAIQWAKMEQLPDLLGEYPLIVNATPVGMWPHTEGLPFSLPENLSKQVIVADIIYNPEETLLLKQAKSLGYKTINGVGMLVWQAALAIKLWCEEMPDVVVMRKALLDYLRQDATKKLGDAVVSK